MIKLLLLAMILTGVSYAEETPAETPAVETPATKTTKSLKYRTHSIAISQRLGGTMGYQNIIGVDSIGGDDISIGGYSYPRYNVGNFLTSIEFFTQRRKGRSQYTPMVAIRLGYNGSDDLAHNYAGFYWGVLFGGSQYLFDFRSKETGLGWSMMANGGFTIDLIGDLDKFTELKYPMMLGGEVDLKAIYNFHEQIGVTFGFNMG